MKEKAEKNNKMSNSSQAAAGQNSGEETSKKGKKKKTNKSTGKIKSEKSDLSSKKKNQEDSPDDDGDVSSEQLQYDAYAGYKIGLTCLENDVEKTENCLERALSARIQLLGETHSDIADVSENLGDIKVLKELRSVAVVHYRKALSILNLLIADNKKPDKIADKIFRVESKLANALYELNFKHGKEEGRDEALKLYTKVVPLKRNRCKANDKDLNRMVFNLGKLHLKKGKYAEALTYFKEVLESEKKFGSENTQDEFFASLLFESGLASERSGELENAENYYKELLVHRERSGKGDVNNVLYYIARALLNSNKYEESLDFWEKLLRAIEGDEEKGGWKGDIMNKMATVRINMGNYQEAIEIYENLLQFRKKKKSKKEGGNVGRIHINLGNLHKKLGHYVTAISSYETAMKSKKKKSKKLDNNTIVTVLNDIAFCCLKERLYEKALESCKNSLDRNLEKTEELIQQKKVTYTTMGSIHLKLLDFGKSTKYYQDAKDLHESCNDRDNRGLCTALINLGRVSRLDCKFDKAHTFFSEALELQIQLCGSNSLEVAKIHNQIGNTFMKEEKYDDALHSFQLVYETENATATNYAIAATAEKIGNLHLIKNEYNLAITHFEDALSLKQKFHIVMGTLPFQLCVAYLKLGDFDKASAHSHAAWQSSIERNGENHENTLVSRSMYARAKSLKGDHVGALSDYEAILNVKQTITTSDESKAITLMELGFVYLKTRKYKLAQDNLSMAHDIILQTCGGNEDAHPAIKLLEEHIKILEKKNKSWFSFIC